MAVSTNYDSRVQTLTERLTHLQTVSRLLADEYHNLLTIIDTDEKAKKAWTERKTTLPIHAEITITQMPQFDEEKILLCIDAMDKFQKQVDLHSAEVQAARKIILENEKTREAWSKLNEPLIKTPNRPTYLQ